MGEAGAVARCRRTADGKSGRQDDRGEPSFHFTEGDGKKERSSSERETGSMEPRTGRAWG